MFFCRKIFTCATAALCVGFSRQGCFSALGSLAGLLFTVTARAHDPFEITAVASVETNRLVMVAEMEFQTARTLAQAGGATTTNTDYPMEFANLQPQFRAAAEKLFQITAAGQSLPLRDNVVTLEVEHHVRFTLTYPPTDARPLHISAPNFSALADDGPYGIGLTVLDMVRKKVLGQTVFFAAKPTAGTDFGAEPVADETQVTDMTNMTNATDVTNGAAPPAPQAIRPTSAWPLALYCLAAVGLLWWLGRRVCR